MKKIIAILFFTLTLLSCGKKEQNYDYTIGITQTVSHKALNDAKKGFIDYLNEKKLNVKFIELNANGDLSIANLNAKNLVNRKVDLIYSIGTLVSQASSNATTNIPIVFSAVTDNISSNLTNDNITGVLDFVDPSIQIKELLKINSNIKKIGFIYNSSEQNSFYQLKILTDTANKFGIKIIDKAVTQVSEIPQVIDTLSKEVDAIYTPADNLVASSIELISEKAIANKKISIGAEKAHVDGGILMSIGINYYDLGRLAGEISYDILKNGKKAKDIKVKTMTDFKLDINENTKKRLGVKF